VKRRGKNGMKIFRVLNNNAVSIIGENEREQIVCGPGIAFQKKKGDEIDETKINKKFVIQNDAMNQKFQQLLADIPLKHIEVADDIISYAKTHIGKRLNESLIISLTDHIYTSLRRFQEGIELKNALIWDIKRFYKDEFDVGLEALAIIEKQFNVRLPKDEAAFIANHIVNAEWDSSVDDISEMTKLMQEISNIVKYFFKIELNEESVYHYRFITHIKFFAQRVLTKSQYGEEGDGLLQILEIKYPNAFQCVKRIKTYIASHYNYQVSDEEKSYLIIHIERLVYKNT
jgi:beta-glucoside operon transcriptional antiterminator